MSGHYLFWGQLLSEYLQTLLEKKRGKAQKTNRKAKEKKKTQNELTSGYFYSDFITVPDPGAESVK